MEIAALMIIAGELFLKLRWIGWRTILRHKRTAIKVLQCTLFHAVTILFVGSYCDLFKNLQCLTLLVMFLEASAVLLRRSSHFRVTRAFRPIFLIDTRSFGEFKSYSLLLIWSSVF